MYQIEFYWHKSKNCEFFDVKIAIGNEEVKFRNPEDACPLTKYMVIDLGCTTSLKRHSIPWSTSMVIFECFQSFAKH